MRRCFTRPTRAIRRIAKFYADAQERVTALAGDLLFFELELNRIDDSKLNAAMAAPALGHYRPWLEDIRKEKPHQLADDLERLFLDKSVSAAAAWNRLFDDTMASLRFDFEGESLTLEPLLGKLQDPDAKIRETAANALAATLGANQRLFALITSTLAKDKETSDRWRKFKDVADSRHLANRVEPEVVEALVTAVTDAYPRLSHRYYALKARWFGKEQLDHWDRNAPLPNAPRRVYKWETARDMVLDAYGAFSPRMADIARRFFDEGWIDAPVRPGKAPGAFAHPTTPSSHPYILVNFLGKARDVTTLAHELGHGVHQVLAGVNGPLMAPTPLTLAETASVFGEMLTFRSMLDTVTDPVERKAMLAAKVEDMLNTVVRQIAFYKFERLVHLERRSGELTAERISQAWMTHAGRKPRACNWAETRLRDLLGLYRAFHSFAVLCLRVCVWRLPGEFAVRSLRAHQRRVRRAVSGDARGRRIEVLFGAARAVRPRREGSRLLDDRPLGDRANDRRTRSDGVGAASNARCPERAERG